MAASLRDSRLRPWRRAWRTPGRAALRSTSRFCHSATRSCRSRTKRRKRRIARRAARRHLRQRLRGLGAWRPLRSLEHLARGGRIRCAAFRRETVHRLDQPPELPAQLLRFALFLSRYGLTDANAPRCVRPAMAAVLRRQNCAARFQSRCSKYSPARLLSTSVSGCSLPEHPLTGLKGALVKRLGLAVAAPGQIQYG